MAVAKRGAQDGQGCRSLAYIWTQRYRQRAARGARDRIGLGPGEARAGQTSGHSYGGYKQSGIGREFSLEGMPESFTQRQNHDS